MAAMLAHRAQRSDVARAAARDDQRLTGDRAGKRNPRRGKLIGAADADQLFAKREELG
jgi:hypothetical protein